jgi:hypothetical protein
MWDIPKLCISAYSNAVQLVSLHPIIISILLHHNKELLTCIREVKEMEEAVAFFFNHMLLLKIDRLCIFIYQDEQPIFHHE